MEQYERNWKNYYEILQVSPNAEISIITAAYKRLARVYHPDANKSHQASQRMRDINEAYETLCDSIKRKQYDIVYKKKFGTQETEEAEKTDEQIIINAMRYVAEEAERGLNRNQIVEKLIKNGWSYDIAVQIVVRVFEYRSEIKRKAGGKQIGCGLLMLIIGGIITWLTYEAASEGGTYIVTTGLFIVGGITFIIGFFRWLTS
jgi:curved DNA-binding protein CbpA